MSSVLAVVFAPKAAERQMLRAGARRNFPAIGSPLAGDLPTFAAPSLLPARGRAQ